MPLFSGSNEVSFLPTEYANQAPLTFGSNLALNIELQLCTEDAYIGCDFEAYINVPFAPWSLGDGIYVNYTILGNSDCSAVLCTNDPTAADPYACKFKLPRLNSPKLYMSSISGNAPIFSATFNMKITCKQKSTRIENTVVLPAKQLKKAICPNNYLPSQRIVRVVEAHSVLTSTLTSDSNRYSILVCPDTNNYAKIEYVAQARDYISAMATFFCRVKECNVNNSPSGWFDNSGTAINNVQIANLKTQQLWFNVYGWGQYLENNTYTFSLNIRND